MLNRRFLSMLGAIAIILVIPLIFMQFSEEVNWSIFDFVIAGSLLFSTALVLELIFRKVKLNKLRIAFSLLLFIVILLVWVELAVGLFNTPFAGS